MNYLYLPSRVLRIICTGKGKMLCTAPDTQQMLSEQELLPLLEGRYKFTELWEAGWIEALFKWQWGHEDHFIHILIGSRGFEWFSSGHLDGFTKLINVVFSKGEDRKRKHFGCMTHSCPEQFILFNWIICNFCNFKIICHYWRKW